MLSLNVAQSISCTEDNVKNPYNVICTLFSGRFVRDRFNILNQYSNFRWIDSVDKVPEPIDTPIKELIDKRANELLGKSITVQWSGGVDSTTVLLSLIKNGISKEDLLIFYDTNSMTEYPKLYLWLKDQGYNMKQIKKWRKELSNTQTDIITNGWCADQLYGSIFFHEGYRDYFSPLPEFLMSISFPFGDLTKEEAHNYAQIYKDAAKQSIDVDLSIAAELGWYINFSLKWTWVSAFNDLFLLDTPSANKTQCFFNTDYFQAWAIGNYKNIAKFNIYGENARYYKQPFKEYCNEVFPDDDYLNNKTKFPSWNAATAVTTSEPLRITIKNNEGYEIVNFPVRVNPPNIDDLSRIFTKYKK